MVQAKPLFGTPLNRAHWASNGLVGCWLMNEGSGLVAYDSSGYSNNGAFSGTIPTWTTSPYGTALLFTVGSPSSYITCGTGLGNKLGGSVLAMSAMTVLKYISGTNNGLLYIGSFSSASGGFEQFKTAYFLEEIAGAGGAASAYTSSFSDTASWHVLISTWDGSFTRIYLDGIQGTPGTYSTPVPLTGLTTILGAYYSSSYGWNGQISNQAIWNRALSAQEVAYLTAFPFAMFDTDDKPFDPSQSNTRIITGSLL